MTIPQWRTHVEVNEVNGVANVLKYRSVGHVQLARIDASQISADTRNTSLYTRCSLVNKKPSCR